MGTVTRNTDYTIEQKSTPLGQYRCPMEGRPLELGQEHTVTLDSGDDYECTCGCTFKWQSELHYSITTFS